MSQIVRIKLAALFILSIALFAEQDFVLGDRVTKNRLNCTDHLQIIDKCSSQTTYSYATSSNKYPISANELRISCTRIPEGLNCIKGYGKCLQPLARRALSSFSSSRSQYVKKICTNMNDPKAIEFWKSNECIKRSNKINNMLSHEKNLISSLQSISKATDMSWDDKFHQSCCVAKTFRTGVINDLSPECEKFKDAQIDNIDSMVGDLLESVCPDEKRLSDICSKLTKLSSSKDWVPKSMTSAAVDLVIALSVDRP